MRHLIQQRRRHQEGRSAATWSPRFIGVLAAGSLGVLPGEETGGRDAAATRVLAAVPRTLSGFGAPPRRKACATASGFRSALRDRDSRCSGRAGYTLIEVLVVMATIAVLASLVFPVVGALKKKRVIAVGQAELKQVETAIEAYKAKLGFYPPDNPGNPLINQLYFELEGTVFANIANTNNVFATLDGSSRIGAGDLSTLYGPNVPGFMNCSKSARGTDESAAAVNFLTGLKPAQIGQMVIKGNPAINALLVCSMKWTATPELVASVTTVDPHAAESGLNPWRYVSSAPTNNPGSYDLWVDLPIRGQTYRVNNWSQQPQVVTP